jgi:hypothetical protein
MTMPTFLGIGVPRGGSTWLHTWLSGHPEIYMPVRRKEIRFFDRHYERGVDWYENFFCSAVEAHLYGAIGEISPQYFYCDECPGRIATTLPKAKLLVMLRHPVDRAYSNYGFTVQRGNYRGSFEDFVAKRPQALEWGFYSRYAKQYLRHFDKSSILPLLFEEVFSKRDITKRKVADFLDVSIDGFPADSFEKRVNPSSVPRFQAASGLAVKTGRRLRRRHLEPLVDVARRLGIQRLIAKGRPLPKIDKQLRSELSRRYVEEFSALEECLDVDLNVWRE